MKKLSVKPKNWLLSVHVASGGIWLGTAFCLVAIAIIKRDTPNGDELYGINSVLKFMDDWVIIPTAMLSLLTGGLLCWLTIWGFTKHYWVIVKWVATVTLITTGTIWLGPWLNAMTAISEAERLQALRNPLYVFDRQGCDCRWFDPNRLPVSHYCNLSTQTLGKTTAQRTKEHKRSRFLQ
jgi:hypothetical protein